MPFEQPDAVHVFRFVTAGSEASDPAALKRFHDAWNTALGPHLLSPSRESVAIRKEPYPFRTDMLQELWVSLKKSGAPRSVSELVADTGNAELWRWPCFEELYTYDHFVVKPETSGKRTKVVALIKRRKEFSLGEFYEYWRNVHGPIVTRFPCLEEYIQCRAIEQAYTFGEPRWDGIAVLGAADMEHCMRMLASPEFLVDGRPHADKFLENVTLTLFQEV